MFIPDSIGKKIDKNLPRNARVIVKNKVASFLSGHNAESKHSNTQYVLHQTVHRNSIKQRASAIGK